MAFAAGNEFVLSKNRGLRVVLWTDVMEAMAACAVGRQRRAVLRCEAMIALEEGLHPVRGQVVFGIDPAGGMAAAADICGNLERGVVLERRDLVFRVTIRAGRGVNIT